MSRRPGTARILAAIAVAGALVAPAPAGAQDEAVIDPLADGTAPPARSELAGSIRVLEPTVRLLVPTVRELRTEARTGDQTTVTISTDVLLDFDSAELTPPAVAVIDDLAARIAGAGGAGGVLVVGHTDGIGSLEYNQDLSERRAAAVATVLEGSLGAGRDITTEGRNFSEPVAPETVGGEDDPGGRAQNRRVEISFDESS